MAAPTGKDLDRLLRDPPSSFVFFLVHGSDAGLVSERVAALTAHRADPADPLSVLRFETSALVAEPTKLADEAYAVSMFGGRRVILLRDSGGRYNAVPILAALMKVPPSETTVVVEAGELKKTAALRKLFENDAKACAIACYSDDAGAVRRLIEAEVGASGLRIRPEARDMLIAQLGGDRLASRGEIVKLCLYAHGKGEITEEDVAAVTGDAAAVDFDEIVDAATLGDVAALTRSLGRAEGDGLRADVVAGALLRHLHMLDVARADVDAGKRPAEAVAAVRPPVFFKRTDAVARMLTIWTAPRLVRAIEIAGRTVRDCRLEPALAWPILSQTLFTLARAAKR